MLSSSEPHFPHPENGNNSICLSVVVRLYDFILPFNKYLWKVSVPAPALGPRDTAVNKMGKVHAGKEPDSSG